MKDDFDRIFAAEFGPDEPHHDGKPNGSAPSVLDIVWADNIALEIDRPGLIDGLLGTAAMTVAYGESGCGKTFVIIDLACRIASGLTWRGLDTQQGVIVYLAAEAPKSVERRVWAWKQYYNVSHLPFVVVRSPVDLLRGDDAEAIIALLVELHAKRGPIALVVVDTVARAMVGNENSGQDMGAFVAACARIRTSVETHIALVHHSGKDQARGARGWSGLRAATDVELEITEGCIKVSKNRDEQEGQVYGFCLEQVELGRNAKGRRVTTCVAVEADAPAGKKRKLGANEQILFEALATAIADQPDPPPPTTGVPAHVKGVKVTRWRDTALLRLPHAEAKRKAEAFDSHHVARGFRPCLPSCGLRVGTVSAGRAGRTLKGDATRATRLVLTHHRSHGSHATPCDPMRPLLGYGCTGVAQVFGITGVPLKEM